jgi:hypothetical protein
MPKGILFWIIYAVLILFGAGWYWRTPGSRPFGPYVLIFLILIGLIGWAVFGPIVR